MNDLTSVIISGQDRTQAAFASVARGLGRLESGFSSLNAAAGALGATLSVAAVATWAQDTIAAASALDDLADATGSTVESLSKLSNIAKVSGADFGTIDAAVKKLAVGLAGTDEESGKAGKALAAMGISARDPGQALLEVAKKFDGYADGAKKAALANAIWKGSGASMIPILKDIADNEEIVGTVTRQQAADAEALEKAWRRLSVEAVGLKNILLTDLVPGLTRAIEQFRIFRSFGQSPINSIIVGSFDDKALAENLQSAKEKLGEMQQTAAEYQSWVAKPWWVPSDEKIQQQQQKVNAYQAIIDRGVAAQRNAALAIGDLLGPKKPDAPTVPDGAKQSVADYTDEIMRLRQEMLKLSSGGDGPYPKLAAATQKYVADLKAGKIVSAEQAMEFFRTAQQADDAATAIKAAADATEAYAKDAEAAWQREKQWSDAAVAATLAIYDQNKALELEHATLGLSDNERAVYITRMKLAQAETEGNTYAVALLTKQLELLNQQAADRSMITYQENWKSVAREIGDSLTDAFMRAFESGKDFGKSLVNSLKSMFNNLVLRPIINAVMSPIAGSITGAAGGMLGYSSSANATSFGGFGNIGSSLAGTAWSPSYNGGVFSGGMGPPDASGAYSQTYGQMAGSYLGAGLAGYGIGTAAHELAGNDRNQAGMQGGATVGAMIGTYIMPGIGTLIGGLIGAIAGSFIKSGGGAKVGGYGAAGNIVPWNRTDQFVGATFQPGHFTPNQEDGAMADAARSWIKQFDKLVKSYGGTAGRGGFDIGRYSDPKGTSDNALAVRGFVNGQQTFNYWNNALGRDEAAMQAEIALVTQRALIAGLQKADIATQISAVFNTLDANTLTQGQIDNVLAFADAMQQVIDAIGGDVAADAATTWANSQRSSVQALVDMGNEVIRLADEFDGSTESMQNLATASQSYRSAVEQVLIAIRTVAQQAQAMQGALVQSIQTSGMTWDQSFNYWTGIADQQAALLATAKSPEDVSKISTAYYTALGNAFSAVPAELQNTYKAPLLGALAEFGTGVEAVLKKIGVDTVAGTESPFAAASKALGDAATKFGTTATTMSTAASDMKLAAADMKEAAADFRASMPLQVQVSYADHLV